MAIVNSLSASNRRRDKMVNYRNSFTYAANISILILALILFSGVGQASDKDLVANAMTEFRILTIFTLGVGICTSLFYMIVIREVQLTERATVLDVRYKASQGIVSESIAEDLKTGKDWIAWLKEGTFYVHGLVYTLVRMAQCVNMTVQPFYLQLVTGYGLGEEVFFDTETGCLNEEESELGSDPTPLELALVPLSQYLLSMLFSIFLMQKMT